MRLDQMCSDIVDCEHKTAPITVGGGYFAVGTPAMKGNVIDYSQAREVSRETFDAWTARLRPRKGDLLFAREAPVGPVVALPSKLNVAPGQRTVLLRPDESLVNSQYLLYVLSSPKVQRRVSDMAMGSTVPHLNVSDVRALELDLPPLPEQQAIAEVLGALDDKIAANARLNELSDKLVRSLYLALPESGRVLGDVARLRSNHVEPSARAGAYLGLEHLPRRLMWVTGFGTSGEVSSTKAEFRTGDVLFGKLRPYFHKVTSAPCSGICSTDILVLQAPEGLSGYLLAAASSDAVIDYVSSRSAGTRMPRATWRDLAAAPVRWSNERDVAKLNVSVNAIRAYAEARGRESQTLAALRDTLLPPLMDGTLRVKDAIRHAEDVL